MTYQPYPEAAARRTGCKVSWWYYDTREEAEACSRVAIHNSYVLQQEGYDFGYCSPGSIQWVEAGNAPQAGDKGRWEVCVG